MYFSTIAIAGLTALSSAAPLAALSKTRQATTASERLGLTWLGGNSSLPKILYATSNRSLSHSLTAAAYCTREAPLPAALFMER
jgi:hypothetical protein